MTNQSSPQQPIPPAPVPPVPQPGYAQHGSYQENPGQTLGIIGIILNVLGISIGGIILGVMSRNKSKEVGMSTTLGTVSLVWGIIATVLGALMLIFWVVVIIIAAVSSDGGSLPSDSYSSGSSSSSSSLYDY